MHEFHLDCSVCGALLDCDNLSISLDEDDVCDEREYSRHVPRQVKCTCLTTVSRKCKT